VNYINQTDPRIPPADPIVVAGDGFQVRFFAADFTGNPIDSVSIGEPFLLQSTVADGRSAPLGVHGAYLSVEFPTSLLAAPPEEWNYGQAFPAGHAGSSSRGLLASAGGFSGEIIFTPKGGEEELLFSIPFTASSAGEATFTLQPDASYGLLRGIDAFLAPPPNSFQLLVVPEPTGLALTGSAVACCISVLATRRRRSCARVA
jgi:hypothetical protein